MGSACNYEAPQALSPFTYDLATLAKVPLPLDGVYEFYDNKDLSASRPDLSSSVIVIINGIKHWNPGFRSTAYDVFYTTIENGLPVRRSGVISVQDPNANITTSSTSICQNGGRFSLVATPAGGSFTILQGTTEIKNAIDAVLPGNNNTTYIINAGNIPLGNVTFKYKVSQGTGSSDNVICVDSFSRVVDVLPFPNVDINQFDSQVCENERINLSSIAVPTSGNLSDITYQWFFRDNNVTTAIPNSNSAQIIIPDADVTGQYIVKATQSNGCMAQDTGIVNVIKLPKVISRVLTDANCFGVSSASVDVSVEGVIDPVGYTFNWRGKKTGITRTGKDQSGLPADTFYITVTTPPLNNGGLMCTVTDSLIIKSHPSIGIDCRPSDASLLCFGNADITLIVSVSPQAVGPFGYSLNSLSGPYDTLNTFTGLGVGNDINILSKNFKVYVRDGNGCIESCEFVLRQPPLLSCSLSKTDLTCFQNGSGSVTATVSGGVAPYEYKWSNGVSTGPTSQTSSTINGLAAGVYVLTVTDANKCISECTIRVDEPSLIHPGLTKDTVCLDFEGSVSSVPTGGTGPYRYQWFLADASDTGMTASDLLGTKDDAIQDFTTWCRFPGQALLGVTVTDANNCTRNDTTSVLFKSCFDLAIRKRVTQPNQAYYSGDLVSFDIEIFNQGDVDAIDVEVSDILDQNMQYDLADNTSVITGNDHDWSVGLDGNIVTVLDRLDAGERKVIKVFLRIKENISSTFLINFAEIIHATSVVSSSDGEKFKKDPVDEDDFKPKDEEKSNEKDDEICDENKNNSGQECNDADKPDDEDKIDFAVVSICQLVGNKSLRSECTTEEAYASGFSLDATLYADVMDPTGNGNGIADNDTGNNLESFHNSCLDAMTGNNPITGKLKFSNGSGGNNATNGILTGSGDLIIFGDQEIEIFGRLVSQDQCVAVSTITLDFSVTPVITEDIKDLTAILDQENLCLEVVADNPGQVSLSYQWQILQNNIFVNIPDAKDEEYCIDKVTDDLDRTQYRVIINDATAANNTCAVYSRIASIEVDGDPVLVCNDLVNISLDDRCLVLITPEMILEDPRFTNRVRVEIKTAQGAAVPNPVTSAYVGQTLTVSIIDDITGNSCWSHIKIEDKLPPVIVCPLDYTVSCANYNFFPPVPLFADGCDPNATISLIKNDFIELECNRTDSIIAVRELSYVAKDKYGNVSKPCTFKVYFKSINIKNTVWPSNIELACKNISGNFADWDTNKNNYPDPGETVLPKILGFDMATYNPLLPKVLLSEHYCRVNITFADQKIDLCGNTFKLIREWTILDWCNGLVQKHSQVISVKDHVAPDVECNENTTYQLYATDHRCTADFKVPAPASVTDCNETTWSIAYLTADNDGKAPEDGIYINDDVVFNSKDYYIVDLPIGKTWIRYTIVDACDNVTYCYSEVEVLDQIVPTPVCDEVTVLSLDAQGKGRLFAKTIDDGSHDNCSKVTFGIRRMNNACSLPADAVFVANYNGSSYYTFVDFCCSDQTNNVQEVELLVIDASGNMNTCMTTVEIQQKVLPVMICPGDLTLDCESAYTPEALNSFASFTAGCPIYNLALPKDSIVELSCGEKTIFRKWSVKENGTNKEVVSCTQKIYIRNLTPFDLEKVVFPDNVTLTNQCNEAKDYGPSNPATGGYPKWTNAGCSQVAVSYTDQIFEVVDDACFKIIRNWTVIDWCTFDLNIPATRKSHSQVIKVIDTDKPQPICSTATFDVTDGCSRNVRIRGVGSDTCTPLEELEFYYSLNGGPTVKDSVFNSTLNVGFHQLTWTVADKCGNSSSCTQIVNVRDVKKPTPYCITEIATVLMPSTLSVAVWAKDYDRGATDNCTSKPCFTFGPNAPVALNRSHYYKMVNGVSIEATQTEYLRGEAEFWDHLQCTSAIIYDCEDLGLKDIQIYVWDEAGNSDYCSVRIKLQDNTGNCGLSRPAIATGDIRGLNGSAMEAVDVIFTDDLSGESVSKPSASDGKYRADHFINEAAYTIHGEKEGDYLNGVSTLDLVMIQRHILGLQPLTNNMLLIAADANNDKKVTAADLTELRKLILGQTLKLAKNTSWKFIYNQDINDVVSPWDLTEKAFFTAHIETEVKHDFTGIKVGDVNLNAILNAADQSTRARSEKMNMYIQDEFVESNQSKIVEVKAGDLKSLYGMQFALDMKNGAIVNDIRAGLLDVKSQNYHLFTDKNGQQILTFSWNTNELLDVKEDDVLFELVLMSGKNGSVKEMLSIRNGQNENELIGVNYGVQDLGIVYRNSQHVESYNNLKVFQNVPNPFSDITSISYYIPKNDIVNIRVTDVDGKLILSRKESKQAGNNELLLSRASLDNRFGVLFVTIGTTDESATIKMIMME
ncbi:MAG: T9SS type A sorting domain-containing protein [Saprospiraceae bacterium]|nr:T9SS type A sorting domain-containing protein [Saprospiraceae bacterium]